VFTGIVQAEVGDSRRMASIALLMRLTGFHLGQFRDIGDAELAAYRFDRTASFMGREGA
jgi:hypothetical protein